MVLIDTHTHLQDSCYDADREEVIKRAQQKNIKYMINVSYDLASSQEAIKLSQKYPNIFAAIGIHPQQAKEWTGQTYLELIRMARSNKIVAVGEIGLDYYRRLSSINTQKEVFIRQLELAQELQVPVIIHNRDAIEETLTILRDFGKRNFTVDKNIAPGVIHCFGGDLAAGLRFIELGFLIGITGSVTFPKAQELKKIAKEIPLDKILIETDAPYLTPQVYRGKRNEPRYLEFIANEIAQLRGISTEEVARETTQNAQNLFKI